MELEQNNSIVEQREAPNMSHLPCHVPDPHYVCQRRAEYPAIQDQLDTLYHGGIEVWRAQIQAVKDKYPKPEEAA